jgi:hypothetical protein
MKFFPRFTDNQIISVSKQVVNGVIYTILFTDRNSILNIVDLIEIKIYIAPPWIPITYVTSLVKNGKQIIKDPKWLINRNIILFENNFLIF